MYNTYQRCVGGTKGGMCNSKPAINEKFCIRHAERLAHVLAKELETFQTQIQQAKDSRLK